MIGKLRFRLTCSFERPYILLTADCLPHFLSFFFFLLSRWAGTGTCPYWTQQLRHYTTIFYFLILISLGEAFSGKNYYNNNVLLGMLRPYIVNCFFFCIFYFLFNKPSLIQPQLPVQGAVLNGFTNMFRKNAFIPSKISNGTPYF
jgi:hypothetical protein